MKKKLLILAGILFIALYIYAFWAYGMKQFVILSKDNIPTENFEIHNTDDLKIENDTVFVNGYPKYILINGEHIIL
jgi:hypothetical protein